MRRCRGGRGCECPHSASQGFWAQGLSSPVVQEVRGEMNGCRNRDMAELQRPRRCHRADRAMVSDARWPVASVD